MGRTGTCCLKVSFCELLFYIKINSHAFPYGISVSLNTLTSGSIELPKGMRTTTKQVGALCKSVITNTEKPLLGTKGHEAERATGKAVTPREVTLTLVLIIWPKGCFCCEGWAVSPTQIVIRAVLAKVTSWGLRKKIESSMGHLDIHIYRCLPVLAKMAASLTWCPCPLPLAWERPYLCVNSSTLPPPSSTKQLVASRGKTFRHKRIISLSHLKWKPSCINLFSYILHLRELQPLPRRPLFFFPFLNEMEGMIQRPNLLYII